LRYIATNYLIFPLSLSTCANHPSLHSFPTRRSSDLSYTSDVLYVSHFMSIVKRIRKFANLRIRESTFYPILFISFSATTFLRPRSEEHTSELQSRENLVCRLLLEKKKKQN